MDWKSINETEHISLAHQICFEQVCANQNPNPSAEAMFSCVKYALKTAKRYLNFPTFASFREDAAKAEAPAESDE